MKIIVLGDIHGRTIWKDIVLKESDADKVIFLGDYGTSHYGITAQQQLDNLNEILDYKEANPLKVILLRGNHCVQFFSWGHCYPTEPEYFAKFPVERYEKLTQWAYRYDNILFTHAGVSNTFLKNNNLTINDLLSLRKFDDPRFGFTPGDRWDDYGTTVTQPPTWIRPQTLATDMISDFIQVVGHTSTHLIYNAGVPLECNDLWMCDTLEQREYLVIENNEFKPTKLNGN